jgi:hypothetical protein
MPRGKKVSRLPALRLFSFNKTDMRKQLRSGARSRSAKKIRTPAVAVRAEVVKIKYERTFEEGISPREFAHAAKLFATIQTLANAIIMVPGIEKVFPATKDRGSHCHPALLLISDLISEGRHYCSERSSGKQLLAQRTEGK